ncbi:MAG TPA: hypothetical protein VM662_00120 [Sphingomonas sp.]|nr:hypothetical protein [Sphingomonas sp.]
MSTRLFLFSLWCLAVVGLFLLSGIYAYSPFADTARPAQRGGFHGPTHK